MKKIIKRIMISLFAVTFMFCGISLIGQVASSKAETTDYRGCILSDSPGNFALEDVRKGVRCIYNYIISGTYSEIITQDKEDFVMELDMEIIEGLDIAWFVMQDYSDLDYYLDIIDDAGIIAQVILLDSNAQDAEDIKFLHPNVSVFYSDFTVLGTDVAERFYPNVADFYTIEIFGQAERSDVKDFKKYYEILGYQVKLTDFSPDYDSFKMINYIDNMIKSDPPFGYGIVCFDENVTSTLKDSLEKAAFALDNNYLFYTSDINEMTKDYNFGYLQENYARAIRAEFNRIYNGQAGKGIVKLIPSIINL